AAGLAAERQRPAAAPVISPRGAATLTVTLIGGGRGLNVVPDACSLSIDRRVVAGERATAGVAELTNLARQARPPPGATREILAVDAFLQPRDTPWLPQLAQWSGLAPRIAPYGTNASCYAAC